jgi:outer membrane protein
MERLTGTVRSFLYTALALATAAVQAQAPLDDHVRQGLDSNLVLREKNIALDRALADLQVAKALFLPAVGLQASYLVGEGGRYSDFPVGDLVNPVYRTLNQMIGHNVFPMVENVQAYLNPNNYHDAHLRTTLPLLNTELIHGRQARHQRVLLKVQETDIYRRELVKDIKTAYFIVLIGGLMAAPC